MCLAQATFPQLFNPSSHRVFFPWLPRGGGQILPTTLGSRYGPVLKFWPVLKNTLNITGKKAQNPKYEVSSSKTDEMAKDWKMMAKTRNLKTKWFWFRPGWSNFAETGLYGFKITNWEKSSSANGPNSAEFEELRNFRTMGRFSPPLANRVKLAFIYFFCSEQWVIYS